MKALTSSDIRKEFLKYFQDKGHTLCPSDGLIPAHDPTLLFTTAGMVQFKPLWAGGELPYKRAVSIQKCLRAGGKGSDLENVGKTLRHHTFFEMLGNFSFGDYFKKEAIQWAWEFVVDVLEIPKEKLWVSIYEEDDEAYKLWTHCIDSERIVRMGKEDNFWGPAGNAGACGPCSEMYIDLGVDRGCQKSSCAVGCDCERYLEFWNIVFPQYFQEPSGARKPLQHRGIDTGLGLERLATILQGVENNYETDLFRPIVEEILKHGPKDIRYPDNERHKISVHVIADHIRTLVFSISENIIPANEGRGYVIRRILRRALRHARMLGITECLLVDLVHGVVKLMSEAYPHLLETEEHVKKVIRAEENSFALVFSAGLEVLESLIAELRSQKQKVLPGDKIFYLYDTLGFPIDLVQDITADEGFVMDEKGFQRLMDAQKERARAGWQGDKNAQQDEVFKTLAEKLPATKFIGKDLSSLNIQTKILALVEDGQIVDDVQMPDIPEGKTITMSPDSVDMILEKTPFYPAGGGQIGDAGSIEMGEAEFTVLDTRRMGDKIIVHTGCVTKPFIKFKKGDTVNAIVPEERRQNIMAHHTVTHILQAVLQECIDKNIKQAGSYVGDEYLRFDFSHFEALSTAQIKKIEQRVNERIEENGAVTEKVLSLKEAKALGAMALFGEKYAEKVRMISIGEFSKELCGGTHVAHANEIGQFRIVSEKSVAAGIRRIEAIAGKAAEDDLKRKKEKVYELAKDLEIPVYEDISVNLAFKIEPKKNYLGNIAEYRQEKVNSEKKKISDLIASIKLVSQEVPKSLFEAQQALKEREKNLAKEEKNLVKKTAEDICHDVFKVNTVQCVASQVTVSDVPQLRLMMDAIKKKLKSGIFVLGAEIASKGVLLVGVSKDCLKTGYHAGRIVAALAKEAGGSGGGKPELAQAGVPDVSRLEHVVSNAKSIIKNTK